MSTDRWDRIQQLYHAALELQPSQRAGFLTQACPNDPELRREVESLLAYEGQADGLLENPEWKTVGSGETATPASPAMAAGAQLGVFRIVEFLGAGGMGEVYRATDTRLHRDVAIKMLSAEYAPQPQWLSRFQREARAVAALNHPNICTLHDVGPNYLVMELIEGPTLAERMAKGAIPLKEALGIARQIAEALEAAHEKGIVHRDLKPANIKLTAEGTVKVLDFGLAKAQESVAGSAEHSPTLTATGAGMILGTAAYMSPEQAIGKPVDKRADIWSFGVVLWEMLTGHRLFQAETVTQTLAEVLRGPIEFGQLPRETPAAIRVLLRRCLDRDVKNRLRDIGEARIAIEAALAGETPLLEGAPEPGGARHRWLPWGVAAALAVGLAAVSFRYFGETPPAPAAAVRIQIPPPENTTLQPWPAISPDGRKLALTGLGGRLWVHFLESGETRDLIVRGGIASFWSPDSRFLAIPSEGGLKKIEVAGGPLQTVAQLPGPWGGGTWNQDDVIVFADRSVGLFRVPASGGIPVPIAALDPARQETSLFGPSFLPDGRHFVYTRASIDGAKSAVYLGSIDAKPEQQSSKPLIASSSQAAYAPSVDPGTGYLLFMREGALMAQPFDNRRLELRGQAVSVAENVNDAGASEGAWWGSFGTGFWGAFSASANGALVFQPSTASDRQLTWYGREGKVLGTIGEPGDYRDFALSPDGTRLAVSKGRGPAASIWLLDLSQGGASTRFTFGSRETNPVWSPDGSRIIFSSNWDGPYDLYQKPVNSGKDEEVLLHSGENKRPTSWSRDGRFLLYQVIDPKGGQGDICVLPLEGERKPVPFLATVFNEDGARFSPDSRWVAYTSNESGRGEVYVRPFSMSSAGTAVEEGGKWQISDGYGIDPHWRGDGRELYYRSREGGIMAVEIATDPAFRAGKPHPVGPLPDPRRPAPLTLWDCTADGRFLLAPPVKSRPEGYTVVLNWQAGLKK